VEKALAKRVSSYFFAEEPVYSLFERFGLQLGCLVLSSNALKNDVSVLARFSEEEPKHSSQMIRHELFL